MSSVKQLLGFLRLHSAAQQSRHEDCMPISLSEGLSLLYFLHIIPILPQKLLSPPVHWASGYQREIQGDLGQLMRMPPLQHHPSQTGPAELVLHETQSWWWAFLHPCEGQAEHGWGMVSTANSMGMAVHTPSLKECYTSLIQCHMKGMCTCPLEHTYPFYLIF